MPLLLKKQARMVVQISSGLGSITRNRLGMTEPEKNPVANRWIAYNASKAALNMRKCTFYFSMQLVAVCKKHICVTNSVLLLWTHHVGCSCMHHDVHVLCRRIQRIIIYIYIESVLQKPLSLLTS